PLGREEEEAPPRPGSRGEEAALLPRWGRVLRVRFRGQGAPRPSRRAPRARRRSPPALPHVRVRTDPGHLLSAHPRASSVTYPEGERYRSRTAGAVLVRAVRHRCEAR